MQRIVFVSDLHCGSYGGLTPPEYQVHPDIAPGIAEGQGLAWNFYARAMEALQPIDRLICNGDAIDGKGARNSGKELFTSDRNAQAKIAIQCLALAKAKDYAFTYGTGYHTGNGEDFELQVAAAFDAPIKSRLEFQVNGLGFDVGHHIGGSTIPHGRHTQTAKEHLWNTLWNVTHGLPKADVHVFAHVHSHTFCGGSDSVGFPARPWLSLTLPALQWSSEYGSRRCQGTVDFGLVWFDVEDDGTYQWHLATEEILKPLTTVLDFTEGLNDD